MKALTFGKFRLDPGRLTVDGEPTYEEWEAFGPVLGHIERNAKWWLGDWMNYGEDNFGERYAQAIKLTGWTYGTLANIAYVARNVRLSRRRENLESWGHWQAIASLQPAEQDIMIKRCLDDDLKLIGLRDAVRQMKRERVVDSLAEVRGKFHVVYADPPWHYNDSGASAPGTSFQKAENHYPTMSIEEIAAVPVKDHVLPNAVLFQWVTTPMLSACWPVIEAWGFEYKTEVVWDKVDHVVGHYVSVRHEHLLICTRGSCTPSPQDLTPMVDSVQTIKRGRRRHSEKPEEFRQIIERSTPTDPSSRCSVDARSKTGQFGVTRSGRPSRTEVDSVLSMRRRPRHPFWGTSIDAKLRRRSVAWLRNTFYLPGHLTVEQGTRGRWGRKR